MPDNGRGEVGELTEQGRATMGRRVRQPLFERELLEPGIDVMEAVTKTYFEDEQAVNNAAKYIRHLLMFNKNHKMDIAIQAALIKINGNRAIKARSTKYSVQAHGGLFWDSDASEKDKQYLSKLQDRGRRNQEQNNGVNERR